MAWLSLKYSAPSEADSMDSTPSGWTFTTDWRATPRRSLDRVTRRIWPVSYAPKNSRPRLAAPSPHRWQNAAPVGAITGVYQRLGSTGFGPSWLVPCGGAGGVEQSQSGPQP